MSFRPPLLSFRAPLLSFRAKRGISKHAKPRSPKSTRNAPVKAYYVYMMTNKGRTTLYTGVTNGLTRRVSEHRSGESPGFTQRYNLNRLVYYETFNDVRDAIAREKQIKGWSRKKKDDLVVTKNPRWEDLTVTLLGLGEAPGQAWRAGVGG